MAMFKKPLVLWRERDMSHDKDYHHLSDVSTDRTGDQYLYRDRDQDYSSQVIMSLKPSPAAD